MQNIHIYPTYQCNMNCLFCISGGEKQAERMKDLTVAEVIKRLEEANVKKGTTVVYSGGEPTIYKDIIYLIRYSSEKGADVRLLSNCIKFADFNFALQAVKAGMTGVATNFYGHNKETYEYLTQSKGTWKKLIKAVDNLFLLKNKYEYPLYIELKILVTKPIMIRIPELVEFISDRFPKPDLLGIFGASVQGSLRDNKEEISCRISEAAPYVKQSIEIARNHGQNIRVFDIPPCVLEDPEYFRYFNSLHNYYINGQFTPEWNSKNKKFDVINGPRCERCKFYGRCSGVRKEYAKEYGFDELKPIM
ncbi:MAG: radical SAM protein [Euryarchaeota archaeon]|nr:radical SAM protein [Euryarchaeota archaeon]